MLILKLSKVERTEYRATSYRDHDDEGDQATSQRVEQTRAVYIPDPVAKIRNLAPRRNNVPGSRLTFTDGGGYAVQESVEEILGFLGGEVAGRTGEVVQMTEPAVPQPTERRSRRRSEASAEAEIRTIEGNQN